MTKLPSEILEALEDYSSMLEVAELLTKWGHPSDAVSHLRRLVDVVPLLELADVLEAIEAAGSLDVTSEVQERVMPKLLAHLSDPETTYVGDWIRLVRKLAQNRWLHDLSGLLIVARDKKRYLSDRAEAATAIVRNSETSSARAEIARSILRNLLQEDASAAERIRLLSCLYESGLEHEVASCADVLIADKSLQPKDKSSLGQALWRVGQHSQSRTLLDSMTVEEQSDAMLFPWEGQWISHIQGDDRLQNVKMARITSVGDDLFNRLNDAGELVKACGNKAALELILDTASDSAAFPDDRVQAIRQLIDLGFHDLPRHFLASVTETAEETDWWISEMLIELGETEEARKRLGSAIAQCSEGDHDMLAKQLAELKDIKLLQALEERACNSSDETAQ